jgi:uncharacterized protein YukE
MDRYDYYWISINDKFDSLYRTQERADEALEHILKTISKETGMSYITLYGFDEMNEANDYQYAYNYKDFNYNLQKFSKVLRQINVS